MTPLLDEVSVIRPPRAPAESVATDGRRAVESAHRAVARDLEATGRQTRTVRDHSNEEDLLRIEKFLAGDQRAFAQLFDKYRDRVYRLAYRFVRNKEDALEVTQEVFLRVYLSLGSFKTHSKFFTWLYRIAVNRAIDFTRNRKQLPTVGLDTPIIEGREQDMPRRTRPPGPVELAEERELAEKLHEAVSRLSEKHRAVFVLHASEKLSYSEIAGVLGINIGTVMSRLFYARKKLQEILQAQGFEIPERAGARGSEAGDTD